MLNFAKQSILIASSAILLVIAISFVVQPIKAQFCTERWSGTYQTEYTMLGGCRLLVDGYWYPEDVVRIRKPN